MNRREFSKTAAAVAATAVVAPKVMAEPEPNIIFDERAYLEEAGCTPEQIAAMERMRGFQRHVGNIYREVAKEFPQTVPNAHDKKIWCHGNFRIVGKIKHVDSHSNVLVPHFPDYVDLSDIRCVGFWRQAVRNKYTNELKYFAAWGTTDDDIQEVNLGQSVTVHEEIIVSNSDEEIKHFARQSFLRLQESVVEFYNEEV